MNLLVTWQEAKRRQKQAREPWCVATTWKSQEQAVAYYSRRTRIDQDFRGYRQRLCLREAAV